MLIDVPSRPDQIPKIKYIVPISLWFVEKSHRIGLNGRVVGVIIGDMLLYLIKLFTWKVNVLVY